MRFIVANYGTRHLGMLLAHLQSVVETHPEARETVYWQDIPERFIRALRLAFPHADWVRTDYKFAQDPIQRISSKVLCWSRAVEEHAGESAIVFCDSDTLVRRNLAPFFADRSADVVFTVKPENVPLNTGVVLAQGGAAAVAFFHAWREATLRILQTPSEYAQANDPSLHFGGTDQMSFHQLIDYQREKTHYRLCLPGSESDLEIRLRVEPCARLNETNSRELADEIHVVHYKAGWQAILLRGRPFSKFRPRRASWEMLGYFLETLDRGLRQLNLASGEHLAAKDVFILRPWYYRKGKFGVLAYAAWRVRAAVQRGWLILTGRLQPGM